MFNNSGQKIKGWAKALFVILLIIGLFMIIVYHNGVVKKSAVCKRTNFSLSG